MTTMFEEYTPHNDSPIFRISHLGSCRKALGADVLGLREYPTDDEEYEGFDPANPDGDEGLVAAEEGKRHEVHVKEDLVYRYGCRLERDQATIGADYGDFQIVGHIDGVITDSEGNVFQSKKPHLLEVKALKEYRWEWMDQSRLTMFPGYQVQLSMYMFYTSLPSHYVYKNRNTGRWKWFRQPKGRYYVEPDDVISRVRKIMRSAKRDKLLKCDDPSAWVFCPYNSTGLCSWFSDQHQVQVIEDEFLYSALKQLNSIDESLKDLNRSREVIRSKLREFGSRGDVRIQISDPSGYGRPYYVNLNHQSRSVLSSKEMLNVLISEGYSEEDFRAESSSQYLRVTGGGE